MQSERDAEEDAPQKERQSADGEQNDSDDGERDVVILRDPDVEFVARHVRGVTGLIAGVAMQRVAHHHPDDMRPPFAVAGRVRIAFFVGELVMDAVCGHPGDGTAFESQRAANGEEILDALGDFVAAMRQQAMIAHADAEAQGNPVERQGHEKGGPAKEEERGHGAGVEHDESYRRDPVDSISFDNQERLWFARFLAKQMYIVQIDTSMNADTVINRSGKIIRIDSTVVIGSKYYIEDPDGMEPLVALIMML